MPHPVFALPALLRLAFKLGAWALALSIAVMTVGPIGLRPHMAPLGIERGGAFFVLGLFFALAYPRRSWPAACLVIGSGAMLEGLQHFVPGRHGQWDDLAIKAIGGLLGVAAGQALLFVYRRLR